MAKILAERKGKKIDEYKDRIGVSTSVSNTITQQPECKRTYEKLV